MAIINNPAMAQAVQNLAAAFGPPSGSDLHGYANAAATRAQESRIADLFRYAQSGDSFNQSMFDRMGQAAGRWTPNTGYYGVDSQAATQRYGYDTQAATSRANNAADNERALIEAAMTQATDPVSQGAIRPGFNPNDWGVSGPVVPEFAGSTAPLTESQTIAAIIADMPPEMQQARAFGSTPLEQIEGANGAEFATRPQAIGQAPASASDIDGYQNYHVVTPSGEQGMALGRVDPGNGRILTPSGEDITDRAVGLAGTGGGINFEVDGEGGIRFSTGGAGGTVSNTTSLLGAEREAQRVANELSLLFDTLASDDVGVAGNLNQFLTDYGAQVFQNVARGDVAAMRSQLEATSIQLARALSGDSRISNIDREIAARAGVSTGPGESLPGAQSKLATLIVLNAYRSAYASEQLEGRTLPPIDPRVLGELVDGRQISPAVAQRFYDDVLSRRYGPQSGGGGATIAPAPPAPAAPPQAPTPGGQSQADPSIFGPGTAPAQRVIQTPSGPVTIQRVE